MPFALILFGIMFILIGYQNTQAQFWALLKGDFTGSNNFLYWIVSIGVVGAVGYIPKLKPVSDGFLVLILVALFLTKGKGFFSQFQSAVQGTTVANENTPGIPLLPNIGGITPSYEQGNLSIGAVGQ